MNPRQSNRDCQLMGPLPRPTLPTPRTQVQIKMGQVGRVERISSKAFRTSTISNQSRVDLGTINFSQITSTRTRRPTCSAMMEMGPSPHPLKDSSTNKAQGSGRSSPETRLRSVQKTLGNLNLNNLGQCSSGLSISPG